MCANILRKRKRPVTSCGECHRRKQKCDREHPCTICINRGIPEKCSYGHSNGVECVEDISAPPLDLGVQAGYSAGDGNSFSMLKKSLRRQEYTGPCNTGNSNGALPDFVLYQILDLERGLPPYALQLRLVDIFFNEWWWWFSSLEPVSFYKMLDEWHKLDVRDRARGDKDYSYFSALLFQVLAMALQFLQEDAISIRTELGLPSDTRSADLLSMKYSKAGMQLMDILGRHNTCATAIQHDILRGIWLKNFSRGSEGWHSLANAIRQAQELGIHRDFQTRGESFKDEQRGRVWMGLFSWDAYAALTLARPRIIHAGDCARVSPLLLTTTPDSLGHSSTLSNEFLKSLSAGPLLFHYEMAYMIHEMMDFGADKPDLEDYAILNKLHNDMDVLSERISPYFRATDPDISLDNAYKLIPTMRLHLGSLANTFLVSLHRAHVLRRRESCDAAITAALKVLQLQEQLIQIVDKQKWRIYTYSFYTIDASIFLAALLLEKPDTLDKSRHATMSAELQVSLKRLEMMQVASPMAKAGAQMIKKCYDFLGQQECDSHATAVNILQENSRARSKPIADGGSKSTKLRQKRSSDRENAAVQMWIQQMDMAMQPILEGDLTGPFSDDLWDTLLNG